MTLEEQVHNEKINDIHDKIGDLLNGLSVFEATFIMGILVADQANTTLEATKICALIENAAHYVMEDESDEDNLFSDVANEMPV